MSRYVFPDTELVPINATLRYAEEAGFEVRDVESLRELSRALKLAFDFNSFGSYVLHLSQPSRPLVMRPVFPDGLAPFRPSAEIERMKRMGNERRRIRREAPIRASDAALDPIRRLLLPARFLVREVSLARFLRVSLGFELAN
jgi:hypothetical protein